MGITPERDAAVTKRERIDRAARMENVDYPPRLGGWLTCDDQYRGLTGASFEEFWADPEGVAIQAYRNLDVDGLIDFILPSEPGNYRSVDHSTLERREREFPTAESVRDYIRALPDPDSLEATYDASSVEDETLEKMTSWQRKLGDIVWMPARFYDSVCSFMWYDDFGYASYLEALVVYKDWAKKLFEYSGELARLKNGVVARVYEKLGCSKVLHTGQDICGSNGPMVSPAFLDELYWPNVGRAIEPLLRNDFKLIWHCDGYVLPLVDTIIDLGFAGFQGFQEELGVHIADLIEKPAKNGDRLLFFGSFSVTSTLPWGTVQDVRNAVEHSIDVTDGKGLFVLPANTINPEVPPENIRTMYEWPKVYSRARTQR